MLAHHEVVQAVPLAHPAPARPAPAHQPARQARRNKVNTDRICSKKKKKKETKKKKKNDKK